MEQLPDECGLEELGLPTVDLEAEESSLTEQLAAACRDPGVFRLVNHGVPCDLTARLFGLARGLLELEAAKKSRLPGYFCGTPALAALPVKEVNWLEGLHVDAADSSHSSPDDADGEADGTALAAFMEAVSGEYVAHMARIARKLFDALACGELGLDEEQRASYLTERGSIFRAYRYPAAPGAGRRQLGMEAHTDSSVLSILNQDMVGGLQVLYGGRWRAVRPVEDALVVNVGDMLQAMSGDAYRSPEHRVVSPAEMDRMSLCYFAFPQEDAVIVGPPPSSSSTRSSSQRERYRGFSYREFREQVQADVKAIGSKVGLARFRIPVSQS